MTEVSQMVILTSINLFFASIDKLSYVNFRVDLTKTVQNRNIIKVENIMVV